VAVIITLLGPGVIAATSEKMRKGRVCERVIGVISFCLQMLPGKFEHGY
jgi:hypothetical protein